MEDSGERFRLFVAIKVPEVVRNEIICVQRDLQPLAPRGMVRWTKAEQFHLTLRFLGDVSSDRIADLLETVRLVCSDKPVLNLYAHGIGFFPNARSPRVIWVGVNDAENYLAKLQEQIESAVSPFTTEPNGGYFIGHITLGRLKHFNRLEIVKLTGAAERMKDRQFSKWTACEVEVVKSQLSKNGTTYTTLAVCPLRAKIELA